MVMVELLYGGVVIGFVSVGVGPVGKSESVVLSAAVSLAEDEEVCDSISDVTVDDSISEVVVSEAVSLAVSLAEVVVWASVLD